MIAPDKAGLVRAIGRWSLAALLINSIIGSGIFGLPSVVAGLVGGASPLAYLLAALGMGVIMACFAEVASQFREAGGPYLYARAAFGSFVGIQVGWLSWLMRLTAAAAGANLFVTYLAELWPRAIEPLPRAAVITLLVGVIGAINYAGVGAGTRLSTAFTVAKLLALFSFAGAGIVYLLAGHGTGAPASLPHGTLVSWSEAMLLLVFAYGGFEAGLIPMGEAKDPRRDAPFALLVALLTVTALYTLVQVVVIHTLPDPTATTRPIAAAARVMLGPAGARVISAVALISLYGYLSAMTLNTPRLTYALAERGEFPTFFAAIHARFRTPHISILVYTLILWALAWGGTFRWNLLLSAVARLFGYGLVCAALPVLRWKQPNAAAYRVPAGTVWAVLGTLFATALIVRMHKGELIVVLVTMALALITWLWVRVRRSS